MKDSKESGHFWPSYVDVMTTLFAIMLVLFAVSFSRFKVKEKQLQSLVDEYENIITVYSTVSAIDSTSYFGYNKQYLKHLFTVDVQYQSREYDIQYKLRFDNSNPNPEERNIEKANAIRDSIIAAGKLVKKTILSLERSEGNLDNIKFLVIIEGQASRMPYHANDWMNNYTLSYLRAQYLNDFWKRNGIDLESPQCQVIISGSGEGGVPRFVPEEVISKDKYPDPSEYKRMFNAIEEKNQRFLIHIVPVIGNIDVTKAKIEEVKGDSRQNTKTHE